MIKMNELKDRICFIGIGQCGGNIASVAANRGYVTGAINTSDEDLNAPNMDKIPYKLTIGKVGGCGKERKLGQQIVKSEYKDIVSFIQKNFLNDLKALESKGQKKIIYVCFSTGGGTGSGVAPILLSVLSNMFKTGVTFCAIAVTPSYDESLVSLYNSRKCLEELNSLNIPVLIPDNENYEKNVSREAFYNIINKDIVIAISNLIESRQSSIINMDMKDKTKLLSTPGVTTIVSTPLVKSKIKDSISLAKEIESSLSKNVFTGINFDKKVKRVGFIFDIPEEMSKYIDYKQITANIGNPTEIFEGIYPIKKDDETSMVTIILTGLSFPSKKIKTIDDILKSSNETIKTEPEEDIFKSMNKKEVDLFDSLFSDSVPSSSSSEMNSSNDDIDFDIEDILNQF